MRQFSAYMVLFLWLGSVHAQDFPQIQFTHLTENEGLSNNIINAIAQDAEGFIWIGTNDGLNRFDGYKVHHFYHIPGDNNSLPSGMVTSIVCDRSNRVWTCAKEGISCYNKLTGQFNNFQDIPADSSLISDEYTNLYIDHDNSAWVTTSRSLYHVDSLLHYKKKWTGFHKIVYDHKELSSYTNITEDREGQLWAASFDLLYLLDRKTMQVKQRFGPFLGSIRSIFQDSRRQFWIGTFGGGLYRFHPATGKFENIPLQNHTVIVYSLTEWKDRHQSDWVVAGTDHGMILLNPVTLENKSYRYQPGMPQQQFLSGNVVSTVFVDHQGMLWVGTDGGLSYVQPSKQLFELWGIYPPADPFNRTVEDNVYSCSQNGQGLWFTTWFRPGIFLLNATGEIQQKISVSRYRELHLPILQDSLKPYYITCEGDSAIWYTTEQGLVHFDVQSGKSRYYPAPDADDLTGLRTIVKYDDHHWWIRTRNNSGNGLYVFDPVAEQFTRHYKYIRGCATCAPLDIMDMLLSHSSQLYIVSWTDGLFKFDFQREEFVSLLRFSGEKSKQLSNAFECIKEDPSGLLWIGTLKGLIAFDPVLKKIVRDLTDDPQIGGLEILAMHFDETQNLWMNTERGIFCLQPSSGTIRHFSKLDGLPNNMAEGIMELGKDHYMYCGLRDYLVRFQPAKLLQHPHQVADVRFSEASVMDKPYFFQYNSSGRKFIRVNPDQNRFTLDFSVLNYDINDNNHYYYRLDGVMHNWQQNKNGHLAFYNLSPGNYVLYVKGTDPQAGITGKQDMVQIMVIPYWWQTLWFRLVLLTAVLFLSVFLIRKRIENIRRQAGFQQKLAETEMMALRAQMNPHFIFNSLNSIENFIMQNKKRQAIDYLNKFARLIRIILEYSRHDLVSISKDMEALQLYVDLEQLRFNHKFSYETCISNELIEEDYRVPPLLIQPFVENAILHGLANSDRSDLYLRVSAKMEGEYIKYSIEDNGIGRRQAALYKAQNRPKHKSIGLEITRERISMFNNDRLNGNALVMVDLYDKEGTPAGTKAEIRIKPV